MPGTVIAMLKEVGDDVTEGETLAKLSAMKMETSISASKSGKLKAFAVGLGDVLKSGDLIAEIE